ncbi:MAG: uroporphyrinogen decarboxylase [Actinomycetota bacterium]|nr:uroporphyrinogen decarboxylase [Actinomycetota bacterium]
MCNPTSRPRLSEASFLAACRGQPHERVPIWFMRQAGRSLPEYRSLRERYSMGELITTPELAAEVTLQPTRRYDVDAAILFSDIMTPLVALGIGVEIRPDVGPVVDRPFRVPADVERLRPLDAERHYSHVIETVRLLVGELRVPLIGFAGAPFTLASYLVEGGPSKTHARTKALMYRDEATWRRLVERLADVSLAALRAQVEAGAAAVQVFDSWAGALTLDDYATFVLPASRRLFEGMGDLEVPRIHFGVGTGELLPLLAAAGADVVGVDWRVPLDVARERVGEDVTLQGNLDPAHCLAPWRFVAGSVRDVLRRSRGHPSYVFNLGHGVLPGTDPAVLGAIVDLVHDEGVVRPANGRRPHASTEVSGA